MREWEDPTTTNTATASQQHTAPQPPPPPLPKAIAAATSNEKEICTFCSHSNVLRVCRICWYQKCLLDVRWRVSVCAHFFLYGLLRKLFIVEKRSTMFTSRSRGKHTKNALSYTHTYTCTHTPNKSDVSKSSAPLEWTSQRDRKREIALIWNAAIVQFVCFWRK